MQVERGTSQLRGELKTKTDAVVAGHYSLNDFETPKELMDIVDWLLDGAKFAFGGLKVKVC